MRAADKRNKKEIKKERKGGVGDGEGWVGGKGEKGTKGWKKKRKVIISRSFLIQVYTLKCLLASPACLVPGSDYVVLNSTVEEAGRANIHSMHDMEMILTILVLV